MKSSVPILAALLVVASGAGEAAPVKPQPAPPSGRLWSLDASTDPGSFVTSASSARVRDDVLKVEFRPTESYPNVRFPVPPEGWDLSAFAGVGVEVTNAGEHPVHAALRVDNAGDWKEAPWNTAGVRLRPGESRQLRVTFGENNGAPGYPLDASKITGMQVFLVNPKTEGALLLRDLRAFGSAQDLRANPFSTPAEREKTVTPPEWVGQRPPVEGDWVRTLDESFDGAEPDPAVWTVSDQAEPASGALQRYEPKNVSVEDGRLVVRIVHDPRPGSPRVFSTGALNTYDKWTQLYGYFECRAKVAYGRGQWPAFWMMPDRGGDDIRWKRQRTEDGGMEIDIMEILGEWGPGRNNPAVHWDGYGKNHRQWGTSHAYFAGTPDGWHTYGVLWEPGRLVWYVDGVKKAEFVNDRVGSVPGYLILCMQMGGWASHDVDMEKIHEPFQIDHVRAWQLRERLESGQEE